MNTERELNPTVVLDRDRYDELLDIETRLNVFCSLITERDLEVKEIFNIIGRNYLMRDYEERLERERIEREKWLKKGE